MTVGRNECDAHRAPLQILQQRLNWIRNFLLYGSVAQSVEQRPFKALVPGSSPGRPNTIMAWVHILRGASGRYYFGSTDDLERRIAEHKRGDNHPARRFGGTIELVACRELPSIAEARKLEIALKRKKNPKLAVFMLQSPGRRRHGWATCKARCCG